MKTTIEINDALLREVKTFAAERDLTLKAVVDTALRQHINTSTDPTKPAFKLRDGSVGGKGLQPGLDWDDWETILSMAYEGRGG